MHNQKMHLEKSCKALLGAIAKKNTEKIHDLLKKNPDLQRHAYVRGLIFSSAELCTDIIIKLFLKLPKFDLKDSCYTDNHLENILRTGNVKLAKHFFESRVNNRTWQKDSLAVLELISTNLDTRKYMLQLLIQFGFDTRVLNKQGQNLLHQFIDGFVTEDVSDAAEVAEILVNSGIPVDEADAEGWTPLLLSVEKQNIQLVSFLIEKGADVNKLNNWEESPLMIAVEHGNADIVDLLLSDGADVNAKDSKKWTALHDACFYRQDRVLSLLLRMGADVNAEDSDGRPPFFLLYPDKWETYDESMSLMVRKLAEIKYQNLPLSRKNLDLTRASSKVKEHFDACTRELSQMSAAEFYGSYSYYSVLAMSRDVKRLAKLAKNEEFVLEFERNLTQFTNYMDDLWRVFYEAVLVRDRLEILDERLYAAFGDFLPDVVMRKLAEHLTVEDLP